MSAAVELNAEPGPIEAATAGLVSWLAENTGVRVTTSPPTDTADADAEEADADAAEETGLSVWPLALLPEQELRSAGEREPFRFLVRHLVTASAGLLDRVLMAALRAGEPVVSVQPPSEQMWLALRLQPRVALIIDVPTQVRRPTPAAPRVRSPLRLHGGVAPGSVRGRVLGPGDVPLTGVRVELASTGAWAYTDTAGRFAFAAVPAEDPVRLMLSGKGLRLVADVPAAEDVLIRCDFEEA